MNLCEMRRMATLLLIFLFVPKTLGDVNPTEENAPCAYLTEHGVPIESVRYICRTSFLIGYSDQHKVPLWTIERLSRNNLTVSDGSQPPPFREDTEIPIEFRALLDDYKGSGFDRGHLVAAANHYNQPKALAETYLLSNVAPQVGLGLNRGIWKQLEDQVRNRAQCTDELFVFTGVYFTHTNPTSIGPSKVRVPSGFYKLVYAPSTGVVTAFLARNSSYGSSDIEAILSTFPEVHKAAGLDMPFSLNLDATGDGQLKTRTQFEIELTGQHCELRVSHN